MTNKVGRPLKYKTIKDLQKAIDDYFNKCESRIKTFVDKDGNETSALVPEPYTMSGLAYSIGLSRQGVIDYQERDQFLDAIKDARERVHQDVERRLMETQNQSGAIFNLKNNFGWRDKTETDITTGGDKLQSYDPTTAAEFAEFMRSKTKE